MASPDPLPSAPAGRVRPSATEWFALLLGGFFVYRYRWLIDDAFVYFRYVDNLLFLGRGLVYNHGEYVEGYSSPAWTLLLIVLRVTRIGYWELVLGIGLASWVAFWAIAVAVNRAMSPKGSPVLSLPLLFLAANYGAATWFTSGLEEPLVQVAAAAVAWLVVRPSSRCAQVLVAISPLVRPELVLPFVIVFLWVWARTRRLPWFLGTLAVTIQVAWMAFRITYYADLFPNTFHLKDGVYWGQGWRYVADAFLPYHVPWVALALLAALALARNAPASGDAAEGPSKGCGERAVMFLAALPGILYVARIGGTHVHYMYLAFPFCLVLIGLSGAAEGALAGLRSKSLANGLRAALAVAVVGLSFTGYPHHEPRHPFWLEPSGVEVERAIADSNLARHHRDLAYTKRRAEVPLAEILALRDAHPGEPVPHDGIVVHSWCASLYRAMDTVAINRHGLTDGILSRIRCKPMRPGHYPLRPFAVAVRDVQEGATHVGRGMYREAVEAGRAPGWIVANVDELERLASKIYNEHDFLENLRLAFQFRPKIDP